VGSAS
jgi:pyruvate kinase